MQGKKFQALEDDISRRKITSSHLIAERITQFFYDYISKDQWGDEPAQLLDNVKKIGEKLSAADKLNFVVPNTVKRVLHILRESCKYYKIDEELSTNKEGP